VSNGSKIVGLSKKGKPFFSLTSNSSEAIEQILVQGATIWCRQTGGGYTKYTNGEETEFFQVTEGVNWLEFENLVNLDNPDSEAHLDALLGCHDRSIRVIRNGECISNLGVDVNVTSLGCYDKNSLREGRSVWFSELRAGLWRCCESTRTGRACTGGPSPSPRPRTGAR